MIHFLPLVLLAFFGAQADGTEERDLCFFLRKLCDLDGLAVLEEGVTSRQASSYDRRSRFDRTSNAYVEWNANADRGHYVRIEPETGEAVMADLKGPGCINRIWSANPTGLIRFYIDGADEPLEFPFADLCSGRIAPFAAPLVWKRSERLGGDNPASVSYFPIPYAKSCRVAADRAHDQYYHVGYTTFPAGTRVKSFGLPLSEKEKTALADVQNRLNQPGEDPQPSDLTRLEGQNDVQPGQELLVAEIEGPATVRELRLGVDSIERAILRKLLLRIFWEEETQPAVQAPLGDFFGQSFGDEPYRSLPMGFDAGTGYCYFRMPFLKKARILIQHRGKQPAGIRYTVGYRAVDAQPENFAYFHAGWRREKSCATFDYPVLDCRGTGKFIGMALFVDNVHGGSWDDGDEKIFVDGEKFPSYFGTGSGDYFGDAWGIREFECAFHGCSLTKESKQSCYRWHIPDPVPYRNRFLFTIENYRAEAPVKNDYASIAYWYERSGGSDFFAEPSTRDCLPRVPSKVEGALEAENLYPQEKLPQDARIVLDEELESELSAGAGLELTGKAGAFFYLPLKVPRRDVYRINMVTAPGTEAAAYVLTVNDLPVKDRVLLEKGTVLLKAELRGAGANIRLIVDYFQLEPIRKFIRKWAVAGPFDNPENKGLSIAYPPEGEEKVDRAKTYTGKDGVQVAWRTVEAGEDGRVDLIDHMISDTWGVAYAAALVTSPADLETDLYTGSDDGIKIWINGAVVHDHRVDRGLNVDEDEAAVRLAKGPNRILVKVDQGMGAWCFCLRFRDDGDILVYGIEE